MRLAGQQPLEEENLWEEKCQSLIGEGQDLSDSLTVPIQQKNSDDITVSNPEFVTDLKIDIKINTGFQNEVSNFNYEEFENEVFNFNFEEFEKLQYMQTGHKVSISA